jgi:uncharacterized membrane protein YhaH (DUF805 family)
MKFQEAVETCLKKYADFEGEATRSEYWWFALFIFIVGILLTILAKPFAALFYVGTLLPSIAVGIRRLHDTNRSGWWLLVGLVPFVGWLILLIFMTQPGRTAPTPT